MVVPETTSAPKRRAPTDLPLELARLEMALLEMERMGVQSASKTASPT
jgi:hypothetical protein